MPPLASMNLTDFIYTFYVHYCYLFGSELIFAMYPRNLFLLILFGGVKEKEATPVPVSSTCYKYARPRASCCSTCVFKLLVLYSFYLYN